MAEVSDGKSYNVSNEAFAIVSDGDTPGGPGPGLIIYDGTDLKINVSNTETPEWKTITIA